MASLKALSMRIKSVKSAQKTTKVMQMISASKFRSARENLTRARECSEKLAATMQLCGDAENAENAENSEDTVINEHTVGHLVIVISSDRGLCGGFNHSVARCARRYVSTIAEGGASLLFIGKKAHDVMQGAARHCEVLKVVPQVRVLADFLRFKCFLYKIDVELTKFAKVTLIYSKFHSVSSNEPVIAELIPLPKVNCDRELSLYDPSATAIAQKLMMRYLLSQVYLALCESLASEHSCRMMAMESANANTRGMLDRLVLSYNHSRQAAITVDLIEVVSGFEALDER